MANCSKVTLKGIQCTRKATIDGLCTQHHNMIPKTMPNVLLNTEVNIDAITFMELCAGAGGLSSGFIRARIHPILLNDIDKDCCATLKLNHPNTRIECCPFETIDYTPFTDKVNLLAVGAPCQSYSTAGLREGLDDPRGELIIKAITVIYIVKPRMFMIENVPGLLSNEKGETFKFIIGEIEKHQLFQSQVIKC